MQNRKNTGSYYTPEILSDFLSSHIIQKYLTQQNLSILEPSCGDGQFIKSFFKNFNFEDFENIDLDLYDINNEELIKARNITRNYTNVNVNSNHSDYLESYLDTEKRYSIILGNPPYIKKNNLEEVQILTCEKVHEEARKYSSLIKSKGTIKNIWTSFVEASIMSLNETGILCFVIPSEILQVKYAKELRALIVNEFDRVEVFAFNELIFEGIQQDVVALIGIKGLESESEHGFSFYQVDTLEDLKEPKFTEKHSNIHRKTLDKWTNYILTDEELNFIDGCRTNLKNIKNYTSKAQVGIVSAANDYFIVNDEIVKENKLDTLKDTIKPILPKGYVVPNVAFFTIRDFNKLKALNKNINFLHFKNQPKNDFGVVANNYFSKGEKKKEDDSGELHLRYKMKKRDNWYHVPSVWTSQALFVKRSHLYPKIFVNKAKSLATDSFYRVDAKDNFDIKKIVFSFYNSLTFILAELEGRYYGGGVLELTPNEFKELAIPYSENITNDNFQELDNMLRRNADISVILNYTNRILLPDFDVEELEKIRNILVNRRIKKLEVKSKIILKEEIKETNRVKVKNEILI